ncbi:hypothetical protein [Pararhizobium mangrovi]|nr:hypothetical protein [Pararhizobium mangrovi]
MAATRALAVRHDLLRARLSGLILKANEDRRQTDPRAPKISINDVLADQAAGTDTTGVMTEARPLFLEALFPECMPADSDEQPPATDAADDTSIDSHALYGRF